MTKKPANFRTAFFWIASTLVALLLLALGWVFLLAPAQARKEWESVRAALEAKGEKLSAADFPEPKIADEDNFFADPMWAELSDRVVVKTEYGSRTAARLVSEKQQLGVLQNRLSESEVEKFHAEYPELKSAIYVNAPNFVVKRIWTEASKNPALIRRAAELTLRLQEPGEPLIERLRELSQRPDAYFPQDYRVGHLTSEHAVAMNVVGTWLDYRVRVLLALGRSREAFRDVVLTFRLWEALRREHFSYSQQVAISLLGIVTDRVDEGIRLHAWTAEELREFDRLLETVNAPERAAAALRMERAYLVSEIWPALSDKHVAQGMMLFAPEAKNAAKLFWIYKVIWMPSDIALLASMMQQDLEGLDVAKDKGMNTTIFPDRLDEYFTKHPGEVAQVSKSMTRSWQANFSSRLIPLAAFAQTSAHLTRVGIALELYRMEHGEYPEALDAVAPFFPKGIPVDPITMGPFHYKRNADGSFALWSPGWNGTDERGVAGRSVWEGDSVWGE
jgi:hypothetical protein